MWGTRVLRFREWGTRLFGAGLETDWGLGLGVGDFGVEAEVLVALADAAFARDLPGAAGAGAVAVAFFAVGAGALGEGRKRAAAIGFHAQLEDFVAVAVVEADLALVALALEMFEIVFREPAGFGQVGGSLGERTAEALAFFFVAVFVEAPAVVEFGLGAGVFDGAEELAVGTFEDFGDGIGGSFLVFGGLEAGGARHGVGGDLAAIEEGAGVAEIDGLGDEALRDLGEEDLNGFEIFEDGEGDFGSARQDQVAAPAVAHAEVFAVDGAGSAHASGDGEGAAADGGRAQDGVVGDGVRGGGHKSFQSAGHRAQSSEEASWRKSACASEQRSAFSPPCPADKGGAPGENPPYPRSSGG